MHATLQAEVPIATARADMIYVPGGTFLMGPDDRYLEEQPAHCVNVGDFLIDEVPVTNRELAEHISTTGYRTLAEYPPNSPNYPDILPEMLYAGSLGLHSPEGLIGLRHWGQWWLFLKGADWRHPCGPDGVIEGLDDHPVVPVSYDDALIYPRRRARTCRWMRSGRSLHREAGPGRTGVGSRVQPRSTSHD